MVAIEQVSELLGGRKVLGRTLRSSFELIPLLREGLRYAAFETVTGKLDLAIEAAWVGLLLPPRTLALRKRSNRLHPAESERVVRLADVAASAVAVLGTFEKVGRWLTAENHALGGALPIGLLDTGVGARAVDEVLVRIEHGVYS